MRRKGTLLVSWIILSFVALFVASSLHTSAPAVAWANHSEFVTVVINSITNKLIRCFDQEYVVGCSAPDYFAKVMLKSGQDEIFCPPTIVTRDDDTVTGPFVACSGVIIPRPFTVTVEVRDADDTKTPPEASDQADVSKGAGANAEVRPGPGTTSFTLTGDDTDVSLTVTAAPFVSVFRDMLPATAVLDPLIARPPSFDPDLGEPVMVEGRLDHPTRLRFSVVTPAGQTFLLQEGVTGFPSPGVSESPFNFIWDGRLNGVLVPPGAYSLTVAGTTGTPSATVTVMRVARPPGSLSLRRVGPAAPWNARAGPLDIEFLTSSSAQIGLRVRGPAGTAAPGPCASTSAPLVRTVGPTQYQAGIGIIQWDGRNDQQSFMSPGGYCLVLFGTTTTGAALDTSQTAILIVDPPPLQVVVRTYPAVPALVPGEPLRVVAQAIREDGRRRFADTIAVSFGTFFPGGPLPAVVRICRRETTCTVVVPASVVSAGPLAYSAGASDIDNVRSAVTPIRLVDTTSFLIQRVSVSLIVESNGGLRLRPASQTKDVLFHPGTGYDLTTLQGSVGFSDAVGSSIDALLGVDHPRYASSVTRNFEKVNFWITTRPTEISHTGGATSGGATDLCRFPQFSQVSFADVEGVLHTVNCRDNAPADYYSARAPWISWHEFHHAAYGLADEYCCDSNYFSAEPFPNIYPSLADCRQKSESPNLCVQIKHLGDPSKSIDWWRASYPSDDVMIWNVTEYPDDLRRADWSFAQCDLNKC